MIKSLTPYFLSLCILVSGYVHLSAHQYHAYYTPKKTRKGHEFTNTGNGIGKNTYIAIIGSLGHEKNNILDVPFIENEVDEESLSFCFKRYLDVTSIFSIKSLIVLSDSNETSPYTRYIANLSSYRNTLLQVFRI